MAEGGSVKVQLEKVTKELEHEQELWAKDHLPTAPQMFRLGDGEFQHHCHLEAIVQLLKDVLNISDDQMTLTYRTVVLREMRTLRKAAAEARKQALREHITKGVVNKVPPPSI